MLETADLAYAKHGSSDDNKVKKTLGHIDLVKATAIEEDAAGDFKTLIFHGGGETFFYKGTNGRWRDVLDDADLAMYEATKKRVLDPDCATWLEEGGAI